MQIEGERAVIFAYAERYDQGSTLARAYCLSGIDTRMYVFPHQISRSKMCIVLPTKIPRCFKIYLNELIFDHSWFPSTLWKQSFYFEKCTQALYVVFWGLRICIYICKLFYNKIFQNIPTAFFYVNKSMIEINYWLSTIISISSCIYHQPNLRNFPLT